jgi:hypothetical protein
MEKPPKSEVMRQQRLMNARFFGGSLPEIPVYWRACTRYYAEYKHPHRQYPNGLITLSSKNLPRCGWKGLLLHELIHAFLYHTHQEDHPAKDATILEDHSANFTREVNRIARALKMPEVDVSESWAWPWCLLTHIDISEEFHE